MNSDLSYDGFVFSDVGIVVTDINYMTVAPRRNQIETRANRNGGVLVQSRLATKPIYIEGYYTGPSINDAQKMYDMLVQVLNRQERTLIIPHNGGVRRFVATPENISISQPDGLNRILFSIEFVVAEGASFSIEETTLIDTTITTPSATLPLTVEGSALARPVITITINSITGGTAKTLVVRNARDFVGLTFERDFEANDYIVIDSENFQIYVNGVLTEPSGRMPTWQGGAGQLYYSDTFTTRSVNLTATYKRKDL
jgi:hypothetical protein